MAPTKQTATPANVAPLPDFSVAERAALNGTVADTSVMADIPLKSELNFPPMEFYPAYVGPGAPEGTYYTLTQQLGWRPVHHSWVAIDPKQAGWNLSPEGNLVRGERGDHPLLMMPKAVYWERKRREAAANQAKVDGWKEKAENDAKDARAGKSAPGLTMTHFSESKGAGPQSPIGNETLVVDPAGVDA